jgi:hypothetical protein
MKFERWIVMTELLDLIGLEMLYQVVWEVAFKEGQLLSRRDFCDGFLPACVTPFGFIKLLQLHLRVGIIQGQAFMALPEVSKRKATGAVFKGR